MKKTITITTAFFLLLTFQHFQLYSRAGKSLEAVKIKNGLITIDGKLDESAWQNARPVSAFMQYEPGKGEPASLQTEVRILYSTDYIYVGIRCLDPEPDKITARVSKREGELTGDDSIAVALDTFNDGRTAYVFYTNPAGIQKDARIADNGRTLDNTWDGKWLSAGSRTPQGWNAELAVPFETLKFKPGKNITWGLGVTRFQPRKLEIDTWTGPMDSQYKVSQFGTLTGLNLKKTKRNRQIIPHVITRFEKDRDTHVEAGLDVRYAFSQSVSADLTVNPDFATVEADQEQINLTRFKLSLNEKRNFFLEGAEIYSQRIRLFYSRRIADIYGGLKVYGKTDGYEFSALSAQTHKNTELDEASANFTVLRFRKDIFRSSNIGFLLANKVENGIYRGTSGIDFLHFFSEKVNLTGQAAVAYGDHKSRNLAFFLRPSYDSSTFHIHLRYTYLGEHFADNANAVGFVRDDDRHELDSAIEKTLWIKNSWLEKIGYESNYNVYWSTRAGLLRSWQIDQVMEFDFTNKFSLGLEYTEEFKRYEKDFQNRRVEVELGYNLREWQSIKVKYERGKSFDSLYDLFGGSVRFKLGKRLAVEYELDRLHMDPDPEMENTWLHVLRLNYYFNKDLYLKVFFQGNSAISKENIQAVFVYRFQPPFGTLQLAYQKGTGRFGEKGEQGDTLFLKFSYVL